MSRALLAALLVAALLLGGVAAYRWWTAIPVASGAELSAALAVAADADGRIAIAQPRRAARWTTRHRHALLLLAIAAPAAATSLPRVQPLLAPLAAAAQGPLVVWWKGKELAAATQMRPGAARALAMLAARRDLAYRDAEGVGAVATSAALLSAGGATAELPIGLPRLTALAEVGGRIWTVHAEASRLIAATGGFVAVPDRGELSRIEARDASALPRSLGVSLSLPTAPARLLFARTRGWGAAVTGARVPPFLAEAFGVGADATQWNGILGEVLVRTAGPRLVIATSADLLAEVDRDATTDEGSVSGDDLAWLAGELATSLGRMPLLGRESRRLREAEAFVADLERASWRQSAEGARIILEW